MDGGFASLLAIALAGALASPLGGAIAAWTRPTTLLLSVAVGFAAGVLLGTFAFEMLPSAAESASVGIAIGGFALVYLLDLYVHGGVAAGEKASQYGGLARRRRRRRARGDEVTVLAAGTTAEELIEGVSIGLSVATNPKLGLIVGLAIAIDNLSEALSIGELVRAHESRHPARRILLWTSVIGASLLIAALAGWFLLRGLDPPVLGFLLGAGAGGMFYLTIVDLIPEAESHHLGQSAAIATGAGFLLIFGLSNAGA